MTDDATKTRARDVQATRAAFLDSTALTGPRQPEHPLDVEQKTLGSEEVGYDARRDAALAIERFLGSDPRLPAALVRQLGRTRKAVSIASLAQLDTALREHANAGTMSPDGQWATARLADALLYNAASLGSAKAAAACASLCLLRLHAAIASGNHAVAWLAARNGFRHANNARVEIDEAGYVSQDQASQLAPYDDLATALAVSAAVAAAALQQIGVEEDLLRGGVGAKEWVASQADGLAALADDPWPLGSGGWRNRAKAGPTLVVVPSKESLPKQFAREFEPIAGKALALPPAPDPEAFLQAGIARAPWLAEILEVLAHDLVGAPYAWIRPTLLLGGAGAGKTALARWISEQLGLPFRLYSVTSTADGSYSGTSKQWATARYSVTVQTLLASVSPSAVICLDEAEKGSNDRRNGRFDEAILPFLERESSRRILDPGLECEVDLSAVTYIATANDLQGVAGPLRDRFRILRMPLPRRQDLPIVAGNLVAAIRSERGLSEDWLPDLEPDELALLGRHWKGGSLRPLRRLVETLLAGRERAARRH